MRGALVFASLLAVAAVAWFALLVNWVSALLALAAILLYVVGYTMILKRRTPRTSSGAGSRDACRC